MATPSPINILGIKNETVPMCQPCSKTLVKESKMARYKKRIYKKIFVMNIPNITQANYLKPAVNPQHLV
jgi:hypothetical protein